MQETEKIASWIKNNAKEIIANIEYESIEVYEYLSRQFKESDVSENPLFQFVYRSYYRIDNAGLTQEFKKEYFNLLEEFKVKKELEIIEIIDRLYKYRNLKDQKSIQFSFATKLVNTIDKKTPIYDSKVCRVFNFKNPPQKSFDKKVNKYLEQLSIISATYHDILDSGLLSKVIFMFDCKFENNLSPVNKLDFIFWSAGKILTKNDKKNSFENSISKITSV
ncbi:hypothetical protein SAMN04487907_1233 [Zunongwangia mangrovi]|uniref:Uncharacterized protein n=1 Tax=Zunongwangia mangrovi TaxID=1334022 RepID=A0A1I1NI54_9FLAO|nr:hypothetical protein [Zunongwangia mangrovi]SFC95158.1 hypothetical protein SAMN04487907_1233 [Zunongwangia mangrovi]